MIHQIMLVETSSDEESPFLVFPFVLEERAGNAHSLVCIAVVSPHFVVQLVFVVLDTSGKFGRHEQASVEVVVVLCTCHPGEVGSRTIGIEVLVSAIVAVAVDVLCRCIDAQTLFFIGREIVELHTSGIDAVFGLFGNVCFVGRTFQQITSSSVFL